MNTSKFQARPLIANDRGTRLSRQTAEWFAAAGERPQARIELNYNDAGALCS